MPLRLRPRALALSLALTLLGPISGGPAAAAEPDRADEPPAALDESPDAGEPTGPTPPTTETPDDDHAGHEPDAPAPRPDPVPGMTKETFELGPFELAPEGQPGDSASQFMVEVPRPAGHIAVRSIDWEFVDGNGDPVGKDTAHLHHVALLDTGRRDELCAGQLPNDARFAGTSSNLEDLRLDAPYAVESSADADWLGLYMVMNRSDAPIEVSIRYTVGYTDAAADDFIHLDQYHFDVTGCWGRSEFPVPGGGGPGSVHEESRTFTMQRDGVMTRAGGHLHPGGIDVVLTGPDGVVCESVAEHPDGHDDGHHAGLRTSFCPDIDEEFEAGDVYTLTARYDNEHAIEGAMGVLAVHAVHTSPPPPPPPAPFVDVVVDGLDGASLTGTLRCGPTDEEVYLDASVIQTTGRLTVEGWGQHQGVACGPEPTPFRLPLVGNGVLVRGPVSYSVSAYGSAEGHDASGELDVERRTSLGVRPPDAGPLPVTIERWTGRSAAGPVARGSVTCTTAEELMVVVSGWQRAGRFHLPLEGTQRVRCDGATTFEVPVTSRRGQLRSYPATVTVTARGLAPWEIDPDAEPGPDWEWPTESTATKVVGLRGRTPEPDFSPVTDPDSPVVVRSVRRDGDQFSIDLDVAACPTGSIVSLGVGIQPTRARVLGRWWNPAELGGRNHVGFECDGEAHPSVVTIPATFDEPEAAVVVDGGIYDPTNQDPESYIGIDTGATLTIATT